MPEVGDPAPDFRALDTDDQPLALSDFAGRPLVLYFYPKDNTPGCTAQACAFRDRHPDFAGLNAEIVGVSRDSARSHRNFTVKHELPFRLIADTDGAVCRAYDVLRDKSLYGRTFLGIVRTTYVIGPDGVIRAKFDRVQVKGHAEAVLAALEALGRP